MRLDQFKVDPKQYQVGAGIVRQLLWFFVGAPLVRSYLLPISRCKVAILRVFGAQIGSGVRIKPGVHVKFPWRLEVGDHVWLGERTWFDNLATVRIGSHCCISQGVYFCTGSHDWSAETFDLITGPITIGDHTWIAARASVGPGVTVGEGAVLALGGVATKDLDDWTIYAGCPAKAIKHRKTNGEVEPDAATQA